MPRSISQTLSRVLHGIAALALVAMMLVVVADVALRFFFNVPVRGSYDLVSLGLLTMVFFGIGPVIARGAEILIDLIDGLAPLRLLHCLRLLAAFATLGTVVFIGWAMVPPARDAWTYGDQSLELGMPVWVLWAIAFCGMLGILWASLYALWSLLRAGPIPSKTPSSDEKGQS